MKKKWVIGKKDRRVLLIFQKVLAAAFAAIFVGLACNSSVSVERNGRLYEQQINLLENSNSFENSDLFTDILSEEIRGVTRLSVIRSQLETDGTYKGQKKPSVQFNAEGMRRKSDGDAFPYQNFFIRADSGQMGKLWLRDGKGFCDEGTAGRLF